jgi:hypothetical protein
MGGATWGQVEPIQSELKQEYQTILCETENWREDTKMAGRYKNGGKMNRTKNNAKHDKIIQYFPQRTDVITRDRRIGSRSQCYDHELHMYNASVVKYTTKLIAYRVFRT